MAQCLLLALGLYKCHSMGLLPTHESDWLAFSKQRIVSYASPQLMRRETYTRTHTLVFPTAAYRNVQHIFKWVEAAMKCVWRNYHLPLYL